MINTLPIATRTTNKETDIFRASIGLDTRAGDRIVFPQVSSRSDSIYRTDIIEENRPSLVIVEDDEEYSREIMTMTGLCGFVNWYFATFNEKLLLNRLSTISEDIDLLHFDLNMGTASLQDFIDHDAILRIRNRLKGPQVGITSHYASDQISHYRSDIPPEGWSIDYFLPKQDISDEILLSVIFSSSRLREVKRLLANGDGKKRLMTKYDYRVKLEKIYPRLLQYLLPFDASINTFIIQQYTEFMEHIKFLEAKGKKALNRKEIKKMADGLALIEMVNLQAASNNMLIGLFQPGRQHMMQDPSHEIEIILPKYLKIGQQIEVRLLFNTLENRPAYDRKQLREMNITVVVTGPDFTIKDAVRSTGWPSKNRPLMKLQVTPHQLGMRGLRFEFFSGATKLAETSCRTLITRPELFPI